MHVHTHSRACAHTRIEIYIGILISPLSIQGRISDKTLTLTSMENIFANRVTYIFILCV